MVLVAHDGISHDFSVLLTTFYRYGIDTSSMKDWHFADSKLACGQIFGHNRIGLQ